MVPVKPDEIELRFRKRPNASLQERTRPIGILQEGSLRITRPLLGLNAQTKQNNTLLDNLGLTEIAGTLPYAKGNYAF